MPHLPQLLTHIQWSFQVPVGGATAQSPIGKGPDVQQFQCKGLQLGSHHEVFLMPMMVYTVTGVTSRHCHACLMLSIQRPLNTLDKKSAVAYKTCG